MEIISFYGRIISYRWQCHGILVWNSTIIISLLIVKLQVGLWKCVKKTTSILQPPSSWKTVERHWPVMDMSPFMKSEGKHHWFSLVLLLSLIRFFDSVLVMTLNCIHFFIDTGSFLYGCVMRPASQRFFIHSYIYIRILIISYLATFLGTNSISVLMCRKAVNQSINQSIWWNHVVLGLQSSNPLNPKYISDVKSNIQQHTTASLLSSSWKLVLKTVRRTASRFIAFATVAAADWMSPSGSSPMCTTFEIGHLKTVTVHRENTSATPETVAQNYFPFAVAMMKMVWID